MVGSNQKWTKKARTKNGKSSKKQPKRPKIPKEAKTVENIKQLIQLALKCNWAPPKRNTSQKQHTQSKTAICNAVLVESVVSRGVQLKIGVAVKRLLLISLIELRPSRKTKLASKTKNSGSQYNNTEPKFETAGSCSMHIHPNLAHFLKGRNPFEG